MEISRELAASLLADIEIYEERLKLEGSLLEFVKFIFKEFRGEEFIVNWHHKVICELLEEIYEGKRRNLIINIPPRYSKTEIVVKAFMAWCLAKNHRSKFIHLSYSDDLALDNSSQTKEIIQSAPYEQMWGLQLKEDSKSKKKWYTTDGGGVYATSTGGQITGFGAGSTGDEFGGAIIIDDPIKPEDAHSDVIRNKINDRFNNTIKSRMNNPKKTPVIVIMQRLHEEDLTGFLLNGGSEFDFYHLNLPAINETGPHGYDSREEGEALWPLKHEVKHLKAMEKKDVMGYTGQYQQRPAPAEGNMVKRDWVKYHDNEHEVGAFESIIQTWDFTFKKTSTSDFTVGQVWGIKGAKKYLIDQVRGRMNFTESLEAIRSLMNAYPQTEACLVEEKANGAAIIDSLNMEFDCIIPINPKDSKEARLAAVSPQFQAGSIYYPRNEYWVKTIVEELVGFPNQKHDDTVDATTQLLNYLRERRTGELIDDDFGGTLIDEHGGFDSW